MVSLRLTRHFRQRAAGRSQGGRHPRSDCHYTRASRVRRDCVQVLWLILLVPSWLYTTAKVAPAESADAATARTGLASWYGEEHRGKRMANGQPFDPDRLTAACWQYPLGTTVRVSVAGAAGRQPSVVVVVTDRGPAPYLARNGRVIDLSQAAFRQLAPLSDGLVTVSLQREP